MTNFVNIGEFKKQTKLHTYTCAHTQINKKIVKIQLEFI